MGPMESHDLRPFPLIPSLGDGRPLDVTPQRMPPAKKVGETAFKGREPNDKFPLPKISNIRLRRHFRGHPVHCQKSWGPPNSSPDWRTSSLAPGPSRRSLPFILCWEMGIPTKKVKEGRGYRLSRMVRAPQGKVSAE